MNKIENIKDLKVGETYFDVIKDYKDHYKIDKIVVQWVDIETNLISFFSSDYTCTTYNEFDCYDLFCTLEDAKNYINKNNESKQVGITQTEFKGIAVTIQQILETMKVLKKVKFDESDVEVVYTYKYECFKIIFNKLTYNISFITPEAIYRIKGDFKNIYQIESALNMFGWRVELKESESEFKIYNNLR